MAFLSYSLRGCNISPSSLFENFKYIMKQNSVSFNVHCKQTRVINFLYTYPKEISTCYRLILPLQAPVYLKNVYFNFRCVSRWTRYSQNSFLVHQNSKKKRSRSMLFTEKMKTKFQTAKLKTKRRVARTVVEIKENVLTIPNALCALRIVSTPVLGYMVLSEFYATSLGLFIFAGFTDLIDGYIARNFPNQQSMIGSFLDPAADKLLLSTLFITLTISGLIPVLLTSVIVLRDACLMGAGFYIRYVSLPPPKTLSRYFDMSFATARLSPTFLSKANTVIQLSLVAASLAAPVFSYVDHLYLHILWYITGSTTILSAASYLYYNNATYKLFTVTNNYSKK